MSSAGDPIFRRRPDRRGARLAMAAVLSLLVHGWFALTIALFALLGWLASPSAGPSLPEQVSLVNLPSSDWEANRSVGKRPQAQAQKTPAAEPKKEEEQKPDELPKGQVVDVAPGNDEKPPDDAKYLAEHNNKVQKQSRAKDQTAFYKNAMPHRTTTAPPSETTGRDNVSKPSVAGNQGIGNDERAKQDGKTAGHFDVPSAEKRDKVAMLQNDKHGEIQNQQEWDGVKGNSSRVRITPGQLGNENDESASEGRKGDRDVANLMPSAATLDKITGAAANDHLDDVEEGDSTFLNTREFKYATFFNRVKQSVGEHWDPSSPLRERDPEGKIYAYKDRYTMLSVTLDPTGRLKRVTIEKSCGVDFLDTEAVAAFERAQPFPNPPPGLLDKGEVHFTFGFFLEVNSGGSLRIFRSRD